MNLGNVIILKLIPHLGVPLPQEDPLNQPDLPIIIVEETEIVMKSTELE